MGRAGLFTTVLAVYLATGCSSVRSTVGPSAVNPTSGRQPVRILMLTATPAFRHDSLPAAVQVMSSLAASGEFTVTPSEDLSSISTAGLARYDVVMFALTSGELSFSAMQRAALVEFVSSGHGFIGVHSASDTLYEWSDYGRLVGAYFRDHPWTQQATVVIEDESHPVNAGVGGRFSILDEFYTFRDNPRDHVQVLLRLDAASVGSTGDYPLAWGQWF